MVIKCNPKKSEYTQDRSAGPKVQLLLARSKLWTICLIFYGFFKLMYLIIMTRIWYPRAYDKAAKLMNKAVEDARQRSKLSRWEVMRRNFFNTQNLISLATDPDQVAIFGRLSIGDAAPPGVLYTIDKKLCNFHQIFKESSKSIFVLNFGSYS